MLQLIPESFLFFSTKILGFILFHTYQPTQVKNLIRAIYDHLPKLKCVVKAWYIVEYILCEHESGGQLQNLLDITCNGK
jgi:hypothetical protein